LYTFVITITGTFTVKITQGLIDVSIGTVLGVIWGFFLIFVPPSPWAMIYKNQETENTKSQVNRHKNPFEILHNN